MIRHIKRYGGGSRKLYDTEESRYVSLEEVAEWVRRGQELQVVDSGTGEDVTGQTLAQIIYEDQKRGTAFLPSQFLHAVIRRGSRALAEGVGQVQHGMDRLVRASVDKLAPAGGMQQELALLRARLAELEESLEDLEPARPKRRARQGSKRRTAGR